VLKKMSEPFFCTINFRYGTISMFEPPEAYSFSLLTLAINYRRQPLEKM
jgi:hypothetical protein